MKALLSIILLSLILFSCSDDDNSTNPIESEQNFYPLKVGNSWTYSTKSGSQTIRIDQTVTASNGKTAYHIDGDDDYTLGTRILYYEGTELYGVEGGEPVMIFDETTIAKNPQQMNVPAGTFEVYLFDWSSDNSIRKYWFAKGVGVIKAELHGDTRELISYNFN